MIFLCCATCPTRRNTSIFFSNNYEKFLESSICDPNKPFPQMILIPFFERATQLVPNCETYPKYKTALALIIFYHQWTIIFGEDPEVENMLKKVMITWDTKKSTIKKGYELNGKEIKNPVVIGLARTNSTCWVWEGYGHKISESSLVHELVHLALRAKNGHGDRDHEGPKYSGWTSAHTEIILEAKKVLRIFNL